MGGINLGTLESKYMFKKQFEQRYELMIKIR
jgi:hypothetical protein